MEIPHQSSRALIVAFVGTGLVALWLALVIRVEYQGRLAALFLHGSQHPLPAAVQKERPPIFSGSGYDGQFYHIIAHDPWLRRGHAAYVDPPRMRYHRILVPALAWITALGQDRWIDLAYVAISFLFLWFGCYWFARLLSDWGLSIWYGVAFAVFPAVVLSMQRMLVDGLLMALLVGVLWYAHSEKKGKMLTALLGATLCRDTGLLLLAAYAVSLAARRRWMGALVTSLMALPTATWYWYVAQRTPPDLRISWFGWPFAGLLTQFLTVREYAVSGFSSVFLPATDALALLGVAIAVVEGAWLVARGPRTPQVIAVGFYAVLAVVLRRPEIWNVFYGFARTMGPLFGLVSLVGLERRNWRLLIPTCLLMPRLAATLAGFALGVH